MTHCTPSTARSKPGETQQRRQNMSTVTEHEERLYKLCEGVWNGKNLDVADKLVHPEYLIHDQEITDDLRGPELLWGTSVWRRPP